jgi:hypothetical protein
MNIWMSQKTQDDDQDPPPTQDSMMLHMMGQSATANPATKQNAWLLSNFKNAVQPQQADASEVGQQYPATNPSPTPSPGQGGMRFDGHWERLPNGMLHFKQTKQWKDN